MPVPYIAYISGYEKGQTQSMQQDKTRHIFTSRMTRFQSRLHAPCVISGHDGTDTLVCVVRLQRRVGI